MKYYDFIAKCSHTEASALEQMSQPELINKVIFPLWVKPTGQDTRGWRVPDSFMEFMACYGHYCYTQDAYTGAVLYEIAMQRISCGAIPHKHREIKPHEFLPKEYNKYSTLCDQPGLMSPACWSFLRDQTRYLLSLTECKEHATAIVLGILDNTDCHGTTSDEFSLNSERNGVPDPRDLWAWAVRNTVDSDMWTWDAYTPKVIRGLIPEETVFAHFSRPESWRHYLWYWSQKWPKMNGKEKSKFFNNINVSNWWRKYAIKREITHYVCEKRF